MGGLKPEIADGIRMFKPKMLKEAISLARTRDEQLTRQRRFACPIPPNRPAVAVTSINQRTSIVPKRLGWEEMQKRRAQGLCFNCNERFTPGYKCQGPRLLLIEGHDEVQDKEEEAEISDNREYELEVSIHALTGWASPRTMRVAATIKSQPIMVLIDSGSTHNFLSDKVARTLRLPVVPTKSFTVHVANGERLLCQGRFEKVPIDLQGIPFSLTCYSLPLAGLDMVLGIQWLEMLGSVVCNWQYLTMDFNWENQARRLQGIQGPIQATSLETIAKEHRQGEFEDVFQEPCKLPPLREIDHHISLKEGTQPINVRPYRYAYFQKAEIEKQVQAMLDVGIIRPSTSPYSSPVLLVKKKDDTWRFCTDYRALNAATIKDRFPIPTVDDMLDELYGATYFTKLDLRAGYHQVRVHAPDIPKTAFQTHNGHFEYLVMPFGLCNAPSTFQAIMNSIFRPYLRKFILVFFDDILVYSPTWELHLNHVRKTLEILKKHSFFVKATKCDFGKQELEYLGHIVTNHGVKVDGKKIEAMIAWPQPTTITELRGFLGLTGYYRKFVRNYGVLARPLTNLLKKGNFKWDEDAAAAFTMLKQALTTTPTLAMPNFNEPFTIETDASGDGIGAVLTQQGRPIAYMSRALGVTKRSWSIYAKEMLAIVEAIRTWRPYILGRKFFIPTDQRSLKYFLEQRVATSEQQKWVAKLLGYDYEIIYRPGKEIQQLMHCLAAPIALSSTQYLFHKVVVPTALRGQLLQEFHDSKMAGHSGVLRTFKRLAQQFYWPSMYKNIQDYIQQCATCQKTKSETLAPAGLLQPLPIPCLVWDDISLDFIDGLPSSQGKDSIMVVVDRLSKYAHFIALSHPFSAKMIAEKFVENIIKLHGMPKSIISDRDPIFVSKFWQEFFTMSGTQLKLSSAYHPQTDGQTEVVNRCLEQYLRCFVHQWPRKWFSYLSWAEYWYNTTYHCSTGMTPFQALYGRLPPSIPHYADGLSRVNEVDQSLLTRDEVLQQLKTNLELAATRMKHVADQKRREVEFQIGDLVLLKLHPYRQHSVFKRAHQKLANRFYGPFPVEQKLGKVAYRLSLPPEVKIHPVFHVSLLKKYVGTSLPALVDLPPISNEGQLQVTPEKVVNTRWIKRGTKFIEESLVQWKNLPIEDATWEDT
ncbi:Retrovirus-related Pol polyprotein from transposon 17.6 [Vitis vinifera]|uniref:Retrovirus-related Pol polyprotein from transposon 17.6 n=1 Tax=Vitis vinifera TaxID=29760 RepID=A0A438G5F6_VITVI|nr:Retrovirus-related Pol polyprotein from transposon 17.6 [Vitis vinifera]